MRSPNSPDNAYVDTLSQSIPWEDAVSVRALIVDDSRFVRTFIKDSLIKLGMHTVEAVDGSVALDLLRSGASFDLMLIDMNMPLVNGLECVSVLRAESLGHNMKIMMVSTESDHDYIERALSYGADEVLMKPFTPQSLHEKLMLLGFGLAA